MQQLNTIQLFTAYRQRGKSLAMLKAVFDHIWNTPLNKAPVYVHFHDKLLEDALLKAFSTAHTVRLDDIIAAWATRVIYVKSVDALIASLDNNCVVIYDDLKSSELVRLTEAVEPFKAITVFASVYTENTDVEVRKQFEG